MIHARVEAVRNIKNVVPLKFYSLQSWIVILIELWLIVA
jgi:hypothetical protein